MVGILRGAATNASHWERPANFETVEHPRYSATDLALGAVAYLLGVVGVILFAVILVRKLFASSIFFKKSDEDSHKKTVVIGFCE